MRKAVILEQNSVVKSQTNDSWGWHRSLAALLVHARTAALNAQIVSNCSVIGRTEATGFLQKVMAEAKRPRLDETVEGQVEAPEEDGLENLNDPTTQALQEADLLQLQLEQVINLRWHAVAVAKDPWLAPNAISVSLLLDTVSGLVSAGSALQSPHPGRG